MQIETISLANAEKLFPKLTSRYFEKYPLTINTSMNKFTIIGVQDGDDIRTPETITVLLSDARVALVLVLSPYPLTQERVHENYMKIYDKAFESCGYTSINIDGTPYERGGSRLYGMLHPGLIF